MYLYMYVNSNACLKQAAKKDEKESMFSVLRAQGCNHALLSCSLQYNRNVMASTCTSTCIHLLPQIVGSHMSYMFFNAQHLSV